jgi:hypothetical protein
LTQAKLCGMFAATSYVWLAREYCNGITPRKGFGYTLYCNSRASLSRVTNLYFDEFGTIWRCRTNTILRWLYTTVWNSLWSQWTGSGCGGMPSRENDGRSSLAARYSMRLQIRLLQRQELCLLPMIRITGRSKKSAGLVCGDKCAVVIFMRFNIVARCQTCYHTSGQDTAGQKFRRIHWIRLAPRLLLVNVEGARQN